VEFSSHNHFHKLSRSWLLGMCHCSCLLHRLVRDSPPPSSVLSALCPLSHVSSLLLLLITQFLFFSLGGVGRSRGLCCSGPGLSVGVPWYHETHLVVHVFPSRLGASIWQQPGGPPGFSI
jgi:hypothetical protein